MPVLIRGAECTFERMLALDICAHAYNDFTLRLTWLLQDKPYENICLYFLFLIDLLELPEETMSYQSLNLYQNAICKLFRVLLIKLDSRSKQPMIILH